MNGPLRPQPNTRPVVEPRAAPWLLLLRKFQPFAAPDAFYPVLAHSPVSFHQLLRGPAVAEAAILAGHRDDDPGQCILVVTLCRLMALRAEWLLHQLARSPFAGENQRFSLFH
jgi:hypothetical protein